MDERDVLSQSRLSIELFAAEITHHRHVVIVMEHVRPQLCILDEILAANVTLVISPSRVRSDMTIERFLSGKLVSAHRT